MTVVVIIAIVAAAAIPAISVMRRDRRMYDDAGAVAALLRTARTRAIGRGTAVVVSLSTNGVTDRGTFQMWEAVQMNVNNLGQKRTPVTSCKTQISSPWAQGLNGANQSVVFVDGVNLNGTPEGDASITSQLYVYDANNNAGTPKNLAFVCYTPLGRSYVDYVSQAFPNFDVNLPNVGPLEIRVARQGGGTTRSVLLPPSGMARLFSHG